jgi:uncharacterized protein (TIGR00266 family)
MQYEIQGTVMQSVEITLENGEAMFTESGGMAWFLGQVDMKTNAKGGIGAGLGRMLSGESFFLTTYTCLSKKAKIVFTPEVPGKVVPMELAPGQSIIAQKDAFMAASEGVKLEMHFRKKLGAGLFGGEGFILQRLTGPGIAFLEIPGEVKEYELGQGHKLRVDPGHIAAFEPTVNYSIETVKGISNILFSGEGLFLATLSGPGKVWLQTLPLSNLAAKLSRYITVNK